MIKENIVLGWLLKMIGVGDRITTRLEDAHFHMARPGLFWVGMALLLPAAWFVLRRHAASLGHIDPAPRRALGACRITLLLLMVVVLGGPYVSVTEVREQRSLVVVAVDESASMQLGAGFTTLAEVRRVGAELGLLPGPGDAPPPAKPLSEVSGQAGDGDAAPVDKAAADRVRKLTRLDVAERWLESHGKTTLAALAERYELRHYRLARGVRRMDDLAQALAPRPLDKGDDQETAIGGALERIVEDAAGQPIAAILLLTDGRSTVGPEPSQVLSRWAGRARGKPAGTGAAPGLGAPVWPAPMGSAAATRDVALVDLVAPPQVSKGDHIAVLATVASRGFAGRKAWVRLLSGGAVLAEEQVRLSDDGRQQVQLRYEAKESGARMLTVRVETLPEEEVADNNEDTVTVDVDSEKKRILYVEGFPRWDFRFLDHALRRDHGLEATIVMESQLLADGVAPGRLAEAARMPVTREQWAAYALVMLGDVSPAMLTEASQRGLAEAVERDGLGLLVQAGPGHMPHAYARLPLNATLPVRQAPDAERRDEEGQAGRFAPGSKPFTMRLTAAGSLHPALALHAQADRNSAAWAAMPGFHWSAALGEGKAGATILAEVEGPDGVRPLMAEHQLGAGKVLLVGTDSTYLWRRNVGGAVFERFWGQAIRAVAKQPRRGGDQSWLEVAPPRLVAGESASVTLYTLDDQGTPLAASHALVELAHGESRSRIRLERAGQPGHFRGAWRAETVGAHVFSHTDGKGKTRSAEAQVTGSGRELRRPVIDRDAMSGMAQASGGRMIEVDELRRLPELLQDKPVVLRREHTDDVWDNWLVLLLLTGVYCVDIGIRRLLGLV